MPSRLGALCSSKYTYYEPVVTIDPTHLITPSVEIKSKHKKLIFGDSIKINGSDELYVLGGCFRQGKKTFILIINDKNNVIIADINKYVSTVKDITPDIDKYNKIMEDWITTQVLLVIII